LLSGCCQRIGTPPNGVEFQRSQMFFVGDIMIEVLVLRKVFSAKPQQFMLVLQDAMKVQNTEFGAEGEVRTILKAVGISQPDIEKLFEKAKSNI
jgi:3-deoxy-D-manno-octulosonate 8-phosphate phosphatase KdsC-like HAD superfamily phosphatase